MIKNKKKDGKNEESRKWVFHCIFFSTVHMTEVNTILAPMTEYRVNRSSAAYFVCVCVVCVVVIDYCKGMIMYVHVSISYCMHVFDVLLKLSSLECE